MIIYSDTHSHIVPSQLEGFFVDWPNPPSSATLLRILKGSYLIQLAIDDQTQKVVGFVTATSDGVLSAYIPLLEVLPDYQKQGIGKKLVQLILKDLSGFYMIDLLCDPNLQSFYRHLGLTEAQGMMLRNYQYQSGRL